MHVIIADIWYSSAKHLSVVVNFFIFIIISCDGDKMEEVKMDLKISNRIKFKLDTEEGSYELLIKKLNVMEAKKLEAMGQELRKLDKEKDQKQIPLDTVYAKIEEIWEVLVTESNLPKEKFLSWPIPPMIEVINKMIEKQGLDGKKKTN